MKNAELGRYARDSNTRVLLVDDHPIVRHGMAQLINDEPDLEVCGEASTAAEALTLVEDTKPHLALIDLSLEEGSGLELVKQIKARSPSVRMLVVSMHDETLFADRALSAGALGYVTKQNATDKLIEAVRRIQSGQVYLSEQMTNRMLHRFVENEDSAGEDPIDRLSDREIQVFELIGHGVSTRDIAERLHISVKTVETHRENIKRKLDLEANLELIRWAVRWVFEQGQTGAGGTEPAE